MIEFEKTTLDNGLTIIAEKDDTTSMAAVNLLYRVGSKHEESHKTGYAHLFEHLMFGGSIHAPDFDTPLQMAGGENNAFTCNDYTNYYDTVPAVNLDTALWLEADRMANLNINQSALDVQKKVVVEEFKEVCLNRPYGDAWHYLARMCYVQHPYQWPTIGKDIGHIENAELSDIEYFYQKYYAPKNAIISISSPLSHQEVFDRVANWFGKIENSDDAVRDPIPTEPEQDAPREQVVYGQVPMPVFFMAFPMGGRTSKDYYACDLITDILANGRSSRLYRSLVKEKAIVSNIDCYITGSIDNGLIVVEGRPMNGQSIDTCIAAVWEELEKLIHEDLPTQELLKVKNKLISSLAISDISILNKSMSLSYFENLEELDLLNTQEDIYELVTTEDIKACARKHFKHSRVNLLKYLPKKKA